MSALRRATGSGALPQHQVRRVLTTGPRTGHQPRRHDRADRPECSQPDRSRRNEPTFVFATDVSGRPRRWSASLVARPCRSPGSHSVLGRKQGSVGPDVRFSFALRAVRRGGGRPVVSRRSRAGTSPRRPRNQASSSVPESDRSPAPRTSCRGPGRTVLMPSKTLNLSVRSGPHPTRVPLGVPFSVTTRVIPGTLPPGPTPRVDTPSPSR